MYKVEKKQTNWQRRPVDLSYAAVGVTNISKLFQYVEKFEVNNFIHASIVYWEWNGFPA